VNMYGNFKFLKKKIILRLRDRVCSTPEELLSSDLFYEVTTRFVSGLKQRQAPLLQIFDKPIQDIQESDIQQLIEAFQILSKMTLETVPKLMVEGERFVRDPSLLNTFVERLYNYWRDFDRFILCDSTGDRLDQRPYRTFNATIESLMHLVRQVYREIQENITGNPPSVTARSERAPKSRSLPYRNNLPCPPAVIRNFVMFH